MANDKNLKPAKKGEVRNPSGKQPGTPNRSTIARMVLEMECETPDKIYQKLKERYPKLKKKNSIELIGTLQIADKMITDRDTHAYKALQDSAYGRPAQSIQLTGQDGGPVQIEDLSRLTADELRREIAELEARTKASAAGQP